MSVKDLRLCVALFVGVLGVARSATADPVVIYSNFGSTPGYASAAWPGSGWLSSEENAYYMGFQLTEAARLTSVTLPTGWSGAQPVNFGATVFSSVGGALGGVIERMVIPFPADVPSRTITTLTLPSALQPLLSANTLYFLGALPTQVSGPGFAFSSLWPWNNAGVGGPVVVASPAGRFLTQGTLGAFQLTGDLSPTPEPSTMLLFTTGAGLILQRVRRRRMSR